MIAINMYVYTYCLCVKAKNFLLMLLLLLFHFFFFYRFPLHSVDASVQLLLLCSKPAALLKYTHT